MHFFLIIGGGANSLVKSQLPIHKCINTNPNVYINLHDQYVCNQYSCRLKVFSEKTVSYYYFSWNWFNPICNFNFSIYYIGSSTGF